ncbi:MAG: putative actin patch assembly and actin polymerization protein [Vezdaea aestivalis]|nr:MAG: putative actin patch assembly and actin polymerization protein [Vezdaea aestivalis]
MFGGSKKPYTAVTVQIERLTGEQYETDDFSGIVDLIEVLRLQPSGPTEAARALRKKLKYGSVHRQLRALVILDGLIQNAGSNFQRTFADEPLLERLRFAATDPVSDQAVKEKCAQLFAQWRHAYGKTPGLERIAILYQQLPRRKKPKQQQQSKVLKETEFVDDEAQGKKSEPEGSPFGGSSSKEPELPPVPTLGLRKPKKRDKKEKDPKSSFNLAKEKPAMIQNIASASIASTNLTNALKLINRESRRVSDDPETVKRFETCKSLRRQVLRYIHNLASHPESESWLGSLIHANDELVNALIAFEVLDKSIDDDSDSDSDAWQGESEGKIRSRSTSGATGALAGLSLQNPAPPQPRRSSKPSMQLALPPSQPSSRGKGRAQDVELNDAADLSEDDEDDPFADRNAVTPGVEPKSMRW